jgi:hypothetical protein
MTVNFKAVYEKRLQEAFGGYPISINNKLVYGFLVLDTVGEIRKTSSKSYSTIRTNYGAQGSDGSLQNQDVYKVTVRLEDQSIGESSVGFLDTLIDMIIFSVLYAAPGNPELTPAQFFRDFINPKNWEESLRTADTSQQGFLAGIVSFIDGIFTPIDSFLKAKETEKNVIAPSKAYFTKKSYPEMLNNILYEKFWAYLPNKLATGYNFAYRTVTGNIRSVDSITKYFSLTKEDLAWLIDVIFSVENSTTKPIPIWIPNSRFITGTCVKIEETKTTEKLNAIYLEMTFVASNLNTSSLYEVTTSTVTETVSEEARRAPQEAAQDLNPVFVKSLIEAGVTSGSIQLQNGEYLPRSIISTGSSAQALVNLASENTGSENPREKSKKDRKYVPGK